MADDLKAALEFYADSENYRFNPDPWAKHDSAIMEDGGKRARALLERLDRLLINDNQLL